jgi:hypothetical protein
MDNEEGKMESKNRNVWIIVAAVVALGCCCALAAFAGAMAMLELSVPDLNLGSLQRERIEETFNVGEAPFLDITNFAGDVTIRPGQDSTIYVVATKRSMGRGNLDRIRVDMTKRGDSVVISTRTLNRTGSNSVELEISAPPGTRVELDSGAGNVDIRGLSGPIEVDNGAGNISIRDVDGQIDANSGAGTFDVRNVSGQVRLGLGAGEITYEGNPTGDCRFHTGAGNISLRVPDDLNMKVDLGAGLGRVDVDFAVAGTVKPREVEGTIGDGSQGTIRAQSGAGNVSLRRQ